MSLSSRKALLAYVSFWKGFTNFLMATFSFLRTSKAELCKKKYIQVEILKKQLVLFTPERALSSVSFVEGASCLEVHKVD